MIFELSRDYERAWQLMQQGDHLPCWVDCEVNRKDIACAYKWRGIPLITVRGTNYIYLYGEENNFDKFCQQCTKLNITFYLPLPNNMIVISPEEFTAIATKVIEEKVGKPLDGLIALIEETA